MTDEVRLSPDATATADRIRAIDRELDELETLQVRRVAWGMRGGRVGGWFAHEAEDAGDERKQQLLAERAELVARLKTEVDPH